MNDIAGNIASFKKQLPTQTRLIAVSKTKPITMITSAYEAGQRAFGENYVQELCEKQLALPSDIEWHFIGHLQSNKVKFIAPFVSWIHAVDSEKLLKEINKQAIKNNRIIDCLLQLHIATEESKFGFDIEELNSFCSKLQLPDYANVRIRGLMGMASFSDNENLVGSEFKVIHQVFKELKKTHFANQPKFDQLSIGMSSDWKIAINEGSTMVRIGSAIFGNR